MENILEVRNLIISFGDKRERYEVVSDISLNIPKGKIVCVVGESGCGKTVTALSIMGLLPIPPGSVDSGEVVFEGTNLLELSENELRDYRGNRLSMIFQEPISSLNPVFTIGDQIGEALRAHKSLSKNEVNKKVIELLDLVGIPAPESRINSYPHELSGGMCQRAMIAMALSCDPELLIADEPTTALDVTIQAGILNLILELKNKIGMAVMLITHDLGIVSEIADEVYVLYAGKVVEKGSRDSIFNNPSHPYTIGLLKSIPSLRERTDSLQSIPGYIPSPKNFPGACRFQDRCGYVFDKCREKEPLLEEVDDSHFSACYKSKDFLHK
ncbi:MAG: ABC transporter ATP-binding protein [Thermodesulfobacteriota bacterium]